MIDRVRYFLGVFNAVLLPPGLLFWFVIHPWAHRWRTLGPARTYSIVLPALVAVGAGLFHNRGKLLGADLGTSWTLIAIALGLYGLTVVELRYWRQLSVRTLIGMPELSRTESRADVLLTDGAYRTVRHPRYLSAGIGVVANALIINHVGIYILVVLLCAAGVVLLRLEERELVDRFGERYRQYQRDVPLIIPNFRHTR